MKKSDFKLQMACIRCNRPAGDLHEIFGGGLRQFSIKNHLQVFVCRDCHLWAEQSKKNTSEYFCEKVGVDYNFLKYCIEKKKEYNFNYIKVAGQIFKKNTMELS